MITEQQRKEEEQVRDLAKGIVKLWAYDHIEEAYDLAFEIFRLGYVAGRRYGDIDFLEKNK